jgi:hypothetical protein
VICGWIDDSLSVAVPERIIEKKRGHKREGPSAHQGGEEGGGDCIGEREENWDAYGNRGSKELTLISLISFNGQFLLLTGTRSMASRVESAPSMTLPMIVYLPSR